MEDNKLEIVVFGYGYRPPFRQLKVLIKELKKYDDLHDQMREFEIVKRGLVDFFDCVTDKTVQFVLVGEKNYLEKTIRCLIEKQTPDLLFSSKQTDYAFKSSKVGYGLAKKILTEEQGTVLVPIKDGKFLADTIIDLRKYMKKE